MRKIIIISGLLVILLLYNCGKIKELAYSGINREKWQKPALVIETLKLEPSSNVAVLGSGAGYFTLRLAGAVGPAGKVYGVDIDPDMTKILKSKINKLKIKNVVIILGKPDDPLLPQKGIDLVFSCNVYHEMKNQREYYKKLHKYLRPNARIAVIDLKPHGMFGFFGSHGTEQDEIVATLKKAGYKLEKRLDFLPEQTFQIFSIRK